MEPNASALEIPTQATPSRAGQGKNPAHGTARDVEIPLLTARPGGPAERYAESLSSRHPVTVFLSAVIAGYVLLAAATTGLGLLLTKVILSVGAISRADERVEVWLAAHRTRSLTSASLVGSIGAGGVVLPIVVGAFLVVFAILHRCRIATFLVAALVVESGAYRLTTIFVHRHRPRVFRLENLPVNASYPSGHTAASVAVYVGLASLLTSRFKNPVLRTVSWVIALAIPPFVAWARLYRGMHHPLDAAAGALLGIGALVVVLFAARAAGVAAERRDSRVESARP